MRQKIISELIYVKFCLFLNNIIRCTAVIKCFERICGFEKSQKRPLSIIHCQICFFVVTIRINVKIHQKQNVAGPKHLMQIRYKNNALSLFFVVSVTSSLQSQSELYHVSWRYYTLVIDLIGQIRQNVFGRLSVKPWCYWLWRLVM